MKKKTKNENKNDKEEQPISCRNCFVGFTLEVHSSLNAVGLTAVVASRLTEAAISCNVIAAAFHDHIFVGAADAEKALEVLLSIPKEKTRRKTESACCC